MTSEQIRYARGLAETHAPKSTDPLRDATEARSTIELLPRLTLRLLDEREALLGAARPFADLLLSAIAKAESP